MVFGILDGMFEFSVMWSELLMTSAISCFLWSSVYKCQRVECEFISLVRTECAIFVICCIQCCIPCQLFCSAWMYISRTCLVLLICTLTI